MRTGSLLPLQASRYLLGPCRNVRTLKRGRSGYQSRNIFSRSSLTRNDGGFGWLYRRSASLAAVTLGTAAVSGFVLIGPFEAQAEGPLREQSTVESLKLKKGASKETNRDILSSQHLQVKKSWENPGVYAWGSNSGRVVAPESDELVIRNPRRISFFDGVLLRDLKLDRNFGAAIDEKGNLLQWGVAYSPNAIRPTMTLRGKDLVSLAISRDRIVALGRNGKVYSIPVAQADQNLGHKPREATWLPFWSSPSDISYRILKPEGLSWGEKVSQISGGLEHVLLLSTKGRLFSAACATEDFPSKGQLGIPGLTWRTRPEGAYDKCHEVATLRGFDIAKVAAGEYHSLALDKQGRLFAFGDNSTGQLGLDLSPQTTMIDAPSLLPTHKLYNRKDIGEPPMVTDIAAGGVNSFITVQVKVPVPNSEDGSRTKKAGRITADTFSCGSGIWGGLGTGRWTHIQGTPTKIKALSGLFEFDDSKNKVVPIRVAYISAGSTHTCAVLDNVTYVGAHERTSEHDTNWGADVLWWGGNEFYQLGTGKRNNVASPTYISPLDLEAEKEKGRDAAHRFQITPRKTVKLNGRKVSIEQRAECGRDVSAVYSGV